MAADDSRGVAAPIAYFNRPADPSEVHLLGTKEQRRAVTSKHVMHVADARGRHDAGALTLQANGMRLARHRPALRDFADRGEVQRSYWPEMAALVKRETGARYAFPYNHIVRTENAQSFTQAYARFAHIDWLHPDAEAASIDSVRKGQLVSFGVPKEEAARLEVCYVNTWQPWDRPAERNPLALLDFASIDLRRDAVKYYYLGSGLREEGFKNVPTDVALRRKGPPSCGVAHHPSHRWMYLPQMQTDEVWIFKQMDSRRGHARCVFHTSFDDPTSAPAAPGRRSVETRVLCAFDPDPSADDGGARPGRGAGRGGGRGKL